MAHERESRAGPVVNLCTDPQVSPPFLHSDRPSRRIASPGTDPDCSRAPIPIHLRADQTSGQVAGFNGSFKVNYSSSLIIT